MKTLIKVLVGGFVGITITAGVSSVMVKGMKPVSASDDVASVITDVDNEVMETSVDKDKKVTDAAFTANWSPTGAFTNAVRCGTN